MESLISTRRTTTKKKKKKKKEEEEKKCNAISPTNIRKFLSVSEDGKGASWKHKRKETYWIRGQSCIPPLHHIQTGKRDREKSIERLLTTLLTSLSPIARVPYRPRQFVLKIKTATITKIKFAFYSSVSLIKFWWRTVCRCEDKNLTEIVDEGNWLRQLPFGKYDLMICNLIVIIFTQEALSCTC